MMPNCDKQKRGSFVLKQTQDPKDSGNSLIKPNTESVHVVKESEGKLPRC